jgi:hypothetical protein
MSALCQKRTSGGALPHNQPPVMKMYGRFFEE